MPGWKVTNRSGLPLDPDSLLIRSLCNADEARTGNVDRSRYIITATAPDPVPANPWNRCSGSSSTD